MPDNGLVRFLEAQNQMYITALSEIRKGKKESHWMWFVFPQLKGLGASENARYFGITGIAEAQAYFDHPILGKNLLEITKALLGHDGRTATQIFGSPDDLKLRSSMTLFASLENTDPLFRQVLEKYYAGNPDTLTLSLLEKANETL
jgi:uncharacterized protein (DUF1810 family)